MNLAAITAAANGEDFSNYGGPASEGYYTGFQDDFVDFDGAGLKFSNAIAANRIVKFTIANTSGVDKTIILFPSYFPEGVGTNKHLMADGAIATGVAGSASPMTVAHLTAWIMQQPTRVPQMRVSTNNTAQLQQTIYLRRKSPFRTLADDSIDLGAFQSEQNNNDKLVTINREFQLDNQTQIDLLVPTATTTVLTFYCGAVMNIASALNNKFNKAVTAHVQNNA